MQPSDKIKKQDFQELIEKALSENTAVSKEAMRVINKYRYNLPKLCANIIFNILSKYKNTKDKHQYDVLIRLVSIAMFTKASPQHKDAIKDLILEALQHSSGTVRESARKMVRNLPFVFDFGYQKNIASGEKEFTQFLFDIESMIKQYAPETIPANVNGLAPSVYKTLVLTWHDMMAMYHLYEKLNYLERMANQDIPAVADYSEGEEPETETFSIKEWKTCIENYFVCEDWAKAAKLLKKRERMSVSFLDWTLKAVGHEDQRKFILSIARQDDSFALAKVLTSIIFEKVDLFDFTSEPDESTIVSFNKVARAIQCIDNNVVLKSEGGSCFSRMLTVVAIQESWLTRPQKVSLLELLEVFDEAHEEIDRIVTGLFKPAENELYQALAKHGTSQGPIDYTEYRQVVHYMLDWILQIDYKTILRKQPKQIAVTLWAVSCEQSPSHLIYGSEHKTLADYAGWSSSSSLTSSRNQLWDLLRMHMQDSSILVVPASNEF